MDGFKAMVKMKTGGSVSKAVEEAKMCSGGKAKYKEGGDVDLKQDKALIKKAIAQHDKQEHPGEKTELKLKKGGRDKKKVGTVKKFKAGGVIEEKSKPAGDKDTIKKVKAAPKKAEAPSKGAAKPAFKGSDVAKEKNKPAGDQNPIKKVKPTGDKKAAAPSKAAVKEKDVKKFADGGSTGYGRGGAIGSQSPIPPSIAAQLMQAQEGTALQGQNPSPMGSPAIPGDNPVMGGGAQGPAPFNAYQNFRRQNPGAKPGMDPRAIQQLLQSPAFQRSNQNFTDR